MKYLEAIFESSAPRPKRNQLWKDIKGALWMGLRKLNKLN